MLSIALATATAAATVIKTVSCALFSGFKIIEKKTAQNRATKKAYKEAVKAFEAAVKDNSKEKEE